GSRKKGKRWSLSCPSLNMIESSAILVFTDRERSDLGRCFAHFVPDKLTLLPIPGSVQRDRAKGDRKEERGGIASFPPEASCTIDLLPAFLHRRKDLSMAIGACQTDLQILTTQDALSSRWKVGAGSARTVPDRRPGAPHDHPCHWGTGK